MTNSKPTYFVLCHNPQTFLHYAEENQLGAVPFYPVETLAYLGYREIKENLPIILLSTRKVIMNDFSNNPDALEILRVVLLQMDENKQDTRELLRYVKKKFPIEEYNRLIASLIENIKP